MKARAWERCQATNIVGSVAEIEQARFNLKKKVVLELVVIMLVVDVVKNTTNDLSCDCT